jgi:hypothetical protein
VWLLLLRSGSRPAATFETTAVKRPESGTKGTSGGITTGTTGTIIAGMIAKTAGTGVGGLKDMTFIVPSTNSTGRSREHTGDIATNIRIATIDANSSALSLRDNSRDGRSYDYPGAVPSVSAPR